MKYLLTIKKMAEAGESKVNRQPIEAHHIKKINLLF